MPTTLGQDCITACADYLKANGKTSLGSITSNILCEIIDRVDAHRQAMSQKTARAARKFTPPTPQEVTDFSASIGYPLNGEAWCLHYEVKGWVTSGSSKMRSWRAAVHKWKAEGWTCGQASNGLKMAGNASLGALQMQLRAVEADMEALLYPGGTQLKIVPQVGTPERARAEDLEKQRLSLKAKIREFAN